jgi:hypothetical protein
MLQTMCDGENRQEKAEVTFCMEEEQGLMGTRITETKKERERDDLGRLMAVTCTVRGSGEHGLKRAVQCCVLYVAVPSHLLMSHTHSHLGSSCRPTRSHTPDVPHTHFHQTISFRRMCFCRCVYPLSTAFSISLSSTRFQTAM